MNTKHTFYSALSMLLYAFIGIVFVTSFSACGPKKPSVSQLRAEKAKQDATLLVQSEQTIRYCDSLLSILLPEVDEQLKQFKYEKDEQYEDHGHYAHKLLATTRNTDRCFIQPYIADNLEITIRSYYYGTYAIKHESVTLSADSNFVTFNGPTHRFESKSPHEDATTFYHEVMTLRQDEALELLRFVDIYRETRTKILLAGRSKYAYYLSENDRQALLDTYQLAVLLQDVHRLEQQKNQASAQISRLERKQSKK